MAMTVTVPTLDGPEGSIRRVIGTYNLDNSYATGGLAFPIASLPARQLVALEVFPKNGYVLTWDGSLTAPKIQAFRQSAATGALTEVPAATDLSAVTSCMFVAYVRT